MKKSGFWLLLLPIVLVSSLFASEGKQTASPNTASITQSIQNKHCGYYFRYPKGSILDRPSDCVLKITLPSFPGADWIQDA